MCKMEQSKYCKMILSDKWTYKLILNKIAYDYANYVVNSYDNNMYSHVNVSRSKTIKLT